MAILPDTALGMSMGTALPSSIAKAAKTEADRAAVTALYVEHGSRIFRFLRDMLGDATLATDATQETFARAFRALDSLDDRRSAVLWLFGIARNVSLELRRARHRTARVMVPEGDPPSARFVAAEGSPERDLLEREAMSIVEAALGRLSDDRREMLVLRLDHGLAYEDIATLMGFSLAKVKVEIFRAREVLRGVMTEYKNGGAR